MQCVLTPTIKLWVFVSPGGLQAPNFGSVSFILTLGQSGVATLLESERHLHVIIIVRDFVQGTSAQKSERSNIKEIVTDDTFVNNLRKALAILASIDALIVKYQSGKVSIFEVMPNFHNLLEEYKKVMSSNIITRLEFEYLIVLA